jgi:peptide/nickel transport system substrate-binding protein
MVRARAGRESEFSRREFLVTTSGALAGVAAFGLVNPAAAAKRHPQRGGTLLFGASTDAGNLDAHAQNQSYTGGPTGLMYIGLTDIDQRGNIVPGVAESWEPNQELTAWTFRLRKGVLFHNGRDVDAEAVKLNIERIKDPAIGGDWERGAVENVDRVEVLDKYTVRIHARVPDVTMPSHVMYYPTRLMAPDAFDTASEHPIGAGPFKFVSWTRYTETRLVRFENYWETDAEGHQLPYLDEIIGKPKREPSVRLTALRTGQVQFINSMAQADIDRFKETPGDEYQLWEWGGAGQFVVFNWRRGPFQDKRLRIAAAHAIDRQAIHHAVYYGHGAMSDQPYQEGNPWHLEGIRSLAYDPDKAKALLKEARGVGTEIKILCNVNNVLHRETAQVVQDLWSKVGFNVNVDLLDTVPWRQARSEGMHPAAIQGHSYRYDPDDFFARNLHSQSEYAKILSGWENARYDALVEEAKRTLDPARRKELYTEAWNIVNVELPFFYLHEVTQTSAAAKELRGYQPGSAGALQYSGGGLRAAWLTA